jgi:hypothetical protein
VITLTLEPEAVLRLQWNHIPAADLDAAAKAIPGARAIPGGYEWGWWSETARGIITKLGVESEVTSQMWWGQLPGPARPDFGPEGWTWVDPARVAATPWRSRTSPKPHQLAFKAWRRGAGRDGLFHPGALLEAGLGLGKTLSAIEEMLELIQHRPAARILVLARNALMETTWAAQLEEHAPELHYTLLNHVRKLRPMMLISVWQGPPIPWVFVHSHEDLPGSLEVDGKPTTMGKILASYEWDMIVVDETSRFRTAGAQRTGRLTGYQAKPLTAPYRLGLSGLPIIKSAANVYPTLRWLGAPTGNKQQFVNRFMYSKPRSFELELLDEPGLRSLLDCWRFQIPKSAVLQIPRAWHYEMVELEPWQRAEYVRVQKELRQLDAESLSSTRLTELLRLAQVTAGFRDDTYRPGNAKLRHLLVRILPELGEDQAIIWVGFRQEALGVARALPAAVAFTGAQDAGENTAAFRSFTQGHSQFFVSTLAKGAMGLNLPMAAHMIYLTRDFDTENYAQSLERNARLTTTHQQLNVTVLEAYNSIDQKVTQILGDDLHEAARLTTLDVKEVLGRG